jgi:hypothetical protein
MPISGDLITYIVNEGYDARDATDTRRAGASARAQAQAYLTAIRTLPGLAGAYIVNSGPDSHDAASRPVPAATKVTLWEWEWE